MQPWHLHTTRYVPAQVWDLMTGACDQTLTHHPCVTDQNSKTCEHVSAQVWDLTTGACDQTLTHHGGKVQAVAWNAAEASVLLSGGFDRAACMVRPPGAGLPPAHESG